MLRLSMIVFLSFSFTSFTGCLNAKQEITEKEVVDFASQVEESVVKRHATLINDIFDKEGFRMSVVERNSRASSKQINDVVANIGSARLGTKLIQAMGSKGTFRIVKKYKKDNTHHLVFRLFTGANLNYYDFELIKRSGAIKIADMYVYATGQYASETIFESMAIFDGLPLKTEKNSNDVGKKIENMMGLMRKGESEKAQKIYDEIPDDLKKRRLLQIAHVQLSAGISDEKYMEAIREFQALFPNSPNMYLLLIDKYFLMEDYKNALQNVNHLDSVINRDPWLDYYRAIIYEKMNDQANRKKSLDQLHQSMPDFVEGNINLINYYLETKDDEKAISLTEKLINTKKIRQSDLEPLFLLYPDYKKKIKI